jgi:arylsulfatase A-like enzyme/Flp pilus assembly protein TadD
VLLITIDTLRADHLGSYGATHTRTPALDRLAQEGVRVDRAWATAPITLPSHASILSGRYPPSHGSRHNGVPPDATIPTLATALKARGLATAAFVSAFPLDRRFGLARGFDQYDDELPLAPDGTTVNERAGRETVRQAITWLATHREAPFFLWVHLFDPHAPYGNPADGRSARDRYADEITAVDQEIARLVAALGPAAGTTLIVATADHGEAFGEHGEVGHSVFVYDTTLRVPLLFRGPAVPQGQVLRGDVSLVDIAPTVLALMGTRMDTDGTSLAPAFASGHAGARAIYAESFAPLLDFGWAGLRSVRADGWKYIAAPRPELFALERDPDESRNVIDAEAARAARLETQVGRWSGAEPGSMAPARADTARLRSLGYLQGTSSAPAGPRADPKDRVALASRIATVTAGEVQGAALRQALSAILRDDPGNPQAHLRLGYVYLSERRCPAAEPHLRAAMASGMPGADAGLGLAGCRGQAGDLAGARQALLSAREAEAGNPVVAANLGLLALEEGRVPEAIRELEAALSRNPHLAQARFGLARAWARSGNRDAARREAQTLLNQLAPSAPQRSEVERFLRALVE